MEYEAGDYKKLAVKQYPPRSIRETAEGKYWQRFKAPLFAKQVCFVFLECLLRGLAHQFQNRESTITPSLSRAWDRALARRTHPAGAKAAQRAHGPCWRKTSLSLTPLSLSPLNAHPVWSRLAHRLLPAGALPLCHHLGDAGESCLCLTKRAVALPHAHAPTLLQHTTK